MSEQNQTPHILDGFSMGEEMANHDGVVCYPAIENSSEDKYIVKKISVPSTPVQLDALLLTGAYATREDALAYYKDLAQEILRECKTLSELSNLEGFVPYRASEISDKEDGSGYDVTLIASYRTSLEQIFQEQIMTHQGILDLAMDLCAALAACRRAGYLYVDLKPGNIFYTENMDYRIGDLGFVPLSSLRFASLPEKYRSAYTAPEIEDALSQLNTTMDVYALGLILYQAYNGGTLPMHGSRPAQPLMPPVYADYEMAEIILTACHPEESQRWSDPTQLGQALVQYMQRNGVSDQPIVPAPVATPELDAGEDFLPEENISDQEEWSSIPELAFLQELVDDETAPTEESASGLADTAISEETTQILAQAEELIALTPPDPVVAPAPIEVPMPEPIVLEPESTGEPEPEISVEEASPAEADESSGEEELPAEVPEEPLPAEPEEGKTEAEAETDPEPEAEEPEEKPNPVREKKPANPRKKQAIRLSVTLLIVLLLSVAAFMGYQYYQNTYLKTIDQLSISGTADTLTVSVITDAEESLLRITCSDAYGNTLTSPVTDGSAVFTGLSPQTRYTIRVTIEGNHKLTGAISDTFTTASQTIVENFTAVIGPSDGSAYLSFQVSGVECDQWILTWSAPGVEEQSQQFAGHAITVTDLLIGKAYTFTLAAGDESNVVGQPQVTYVARAITRAQNPVITACGNGVLTVAWESPAGETVTQWTVRCKDQSGFDQTVTTTECTATFQGLTHETACTVEITAEGMTQSVVVSICADPINITSITNEVDAAGDLRIAWEFTGTMPSGIWRVTWSCDSLQGQPIETVENYILLPSVPGGEYTISLVPTDGTAIFGHTCSFTAPEAEAFSGHGLTTDLLQFTMCAVPDGEPWQWDDIAGEDRRSTFASGEKAGVLVWTEAAIEDVEQITSVTFLLYGSDGTLLDIFTEGHLWNEMWNQGACALNVPLMPQTPGTYTLTICFDGQYVTTLTFEVE